MLGRVLARRSSARILLATLAVVLLVRLAAVPLSPGLAIVCAWLTLPLLAQTLLVSTDPPRSHLTRWWLVSLVFLLVLDVSAAMLDGAPRLFAASLALALAGIAQVVALWGLRRQTAFVEDRGWLWLYGIGLALLVFAATYRGGQFPGTLMVVPVVAAGLAVALASLFATALGPRGTGGGVLGFLAVLVVLISSSLGNEGPAPTIGTVVLGFAGQALILLTILRREEGALDERHSLMVATHNWDGLTPVRLPHDAPAPDGRAPTPTSPATAP